MIPIALAIAALGWDPLVAGQLLLAVVAAVVLPAVLFALSIPFGAGAIGIGDIKLLVSVGLLTGLQRAVLGRRHRGAAVGRVVVAPAAGHPSGHAQELHPVRAVPDRRRVLVGAAVRRPEPAAASTTSAGQPDGPATGELPAAATMSAKPESSSRAVPAEEGGATGGRSRSRRVTTPTELARTMTRQDT